MLYDYVFLFLIFFTYSVIGYLVEVTSVSITNKNLTLSRGYLFGPYIPVFGFGAILMVGLLSKYKSDVLVLFILSLVVCCLLEYFTSLIMEKIFKLRWWDYSSKRFNINGRVCLENGILFGLSGIILVEVFNPLLVNFLLLWNKNILVIVGIILFCIMFADFIISTYAVLKLKIDTNLYINTDATAAIKEQIIKSLEKYSFLHRRLLKAFPHIKTSINLKNILEFVEVKKKK